jgi:hypothetical protein
VKLYKHHSAGFILGSVGASWRQLGHFQAPETGRKREQSAKIARTQGLGLSSEEKGLNQQGFGLFEEKETKKRLWGQLVPFGPQKP